MESGVLVRERVALGAVSLSARATVGGMVIASAAIRFLLALRRPTANYFPDEYTYSALAHGLAETGRPVVRGVTVHFPALLEPLLAAPFWLTGDPAVAMRLTQAEHALLMSCGAIPVYLLCRRLSLDAHSSVAAAALALVTPNLLYASYLVADPVAYPLVLAAVYAAVVALETPSREAQLVLLALVGLASFARIQYLLLLPVVVVAALLAERFDVRRATAKCGLVVVVALAAGIVTIAAGPSRLAGVYSGLIDRHVTFASLAHQLGTHALLLPFSAGVVLVPGAVIGIGRALARPLSDVERAFGWLVLLLAGGLVAEAVYVGAAVSGNYGERYLICLFPLVPIAFALYARRGGAALSGFLLAAGLGVLAMRVSLAAYTNRGSDSTFLDGVLRAVGTLGIGDGALLFSVAGLLLAAVAGVVALRPERARVALALAIATQAAVAAAATSWDLQNSDWARRTALPADARWIDDAHVGPVTLLQLPRASRGAAIEQLFWNMSLDREAVMPGAASVDSNPSLDVHVARDGSIVDASGRRLRGPLLVDRSYTWIALANARHVRSFSGANTSYELWQPLGPFARVAAEAAGIRADGWLVSRGTLTVWSARQPRTLVLRLSLPATANEDTIHFDVGGLRRALTVEPGSSRSISFAIPRQKQPWTLRWSCDRFTLLPDGSLVSFRITEPRLVTGRLARKARLSTSA